MASYAQPHLALHLLVLHRAFPHHHKETMDLVKSLFTVYPPTPSELLVDPTAAWQQLQHLIDTRQNRRLPIFAALVSRRLWFLDPETPSATLHRMYAFLVLGQNGMLRCEVEYFFNQAHWAVTGIPDPQDPDPVRYAVLAAIPHLLVETFNYNIGLGLPRDTPSYIEDFDELRSRPKIFEKLPEWVAQVPPAPVEVRLPNDEGQFLGSKEDPRACPMLLQMGLLAEKQGLHFI